MDENVPYPWAVADTRKCGTFGIGCTADFDLSELQGSRAPGSQRATVIFERGRAL